MGEQKQTFIEHLTELRKRLIISFLAVGVGFAGSYVVSKQIFNFLAIPLQKALPPDSTMIFTSLPEAFFTYLKVSLLAGIFVASPMVLYQVWLFVAPALYSHEKRYVVPFVIISSLLFLAGGAFGYFVVFPYGFKFFMSFATDYIQPAPKLKEYLSFCSMLLITFGLVFELPVFVLFLTKLGVVDAKMLSKNRRYVILIIFLGAAVLTPPDVVTQVMMAIPLMALYEVSIVLAKLVGKKKARAQDSR